MWGSRYLDLIVYSNFSERNCHLQRSSKMARSAPGLALIALNLEGGLVYLITFTLLFLQTITLVKD